MEKITNIISWIFMIVFALNSVYVLLFTEMEDDFLVLGLFDVSKWTAGLIYLGLAALLFLSLKFEKKKSKN